MTMNQKAAGITMVETIQEDMNATPFVAGARRLSVGIRREGWPMNLRVAAKSGSRKADRPGES